MNQVAKKYIGARADTPEFIFQEWCRKQTVPFSNTGITYWIAAQIINKSLELDLPISSLTIDIDFTSAPISGLSQDFIDFVRKSFTPIPSNDEICSVVRRIWTWPKTDFEPFHEIASSNLNNTHIVSDNFSLEMNSCSSKTLSLMSKDSITLNDIIWSRKDEWLDNLIQDNPDYGFDKLEKPKIKTHITILSSSVVSRYEQLVSELVEKHKSLEKDIRVAGVVHTFDERYPLYETCIMIKIESNFIKNFIDEFNQKSGEKINSVPHITFGVKYRN